MTNNELIFAGICVVGVVAIVGLVVMLLIKTGGNAKFSYKDNNREASIDVKNRNIIDDNDNNSK